MIRVAAVIDRKALAHNLQVARRHAPHSRIYAVVKADAYGHGLTHLGNAFDTADGMAVACLKEATELRELSTRTPILVLEGAFDGQELAQARARHFELVVHAEWQLQMLERDGVAGIPRVWAKFDTGMHRLGFAPGRAEAVRRRLNELGIAGAGVMTHLACADDPGSEDTLRQLRLFEALRTHFPDTPASCANSAGVLFHPASHLDWIRPGIMLYGISPTLDRTGADLGLRPAMTLSARLVSIQDVAAGQRVGYGATWRAPRDTRIGIVSIGYGDGYPWRENAVGEVLVNGIRAPLAGRVSMDMLGVDLTAVPQAGVGDDVVLWGAGLPVEEIARAVGSTPYELVCRVSRRVPWHSAGSVATSPIEASG